MPIYASSRLQWRVALFVLTATFMLQFSTSVEAKQTKAPHASGVKTPTITRSRSKSRRSISLSLSITESFSMELSATRTHTTHSRPRTRTRSRSFEQTMSKSSSMTLSKSLSHSETPKATRSFSQSNEHTGTLTTITPPKTHSRSFSGDVTASRTPTDSQSKTISQSRTLSDTKERTSSRSQTVSNSDSKSFSSEVTATRSRTTSPSLTLTESLSRTFSDPLTRSFSLTDSSSLTKSFSNERTQSPTPTGTASLSKSFSSEVTASMTPTGTASLTRSETGAITFSPTLSFTRSRTSSFSSEITLTPTTTCTVTLTQEQSATKSYSLTDTLQPFKPIELFSNFLFAPRFQNYTTRRFMLFSEGGLGVAPIVALQYQARTYMAEIAVQLMHTTANFDFLTVGARTCSSYYGKLISQTQCFTYANCDMTHQAFSGNSPIRFLGGPLLSSAPTCTKNIYLFGQFAIAGYLATRGTYYSTRMIGPLSVDVAGTSVAAEYPGVNVTSQGPIALLGHRAMSTSTPAFRLYRDKGFDDPSEMILSGGIVKDQGVATQQMVCDHQEIRSFAPVRGVGIGLVAKCRYIDVNGVSQDCLTAQDFHYTCATTDDCVGYTSKLVGLNDASRVKLLDTGSYSEVPFLLHTRTVGYTPEALIPDLNAYGDGVVAMLYYQKLPPENRSCVFRIEGNADSSVAGGNVSIYLLQSSYASSSSKVYITRPGYPKLLAKECGLLQPFVRASDAPSTDAATRFGTDNDCTTYSLCLETGYLPSGTVINIESGTSLLQKRCNFSLSAWVNYTQAPSPTTYNVTIDSVPALNTTRLGLTGRAAFAPVQTADYVTLNVFVSYASKLLLQVVQTVWDCSTRSDCPAYGVKMEAAVIDGANVGTYMPVSYCGGQAAFREGAGVDGQCELERACSDAPLSLPSLLGLASNVSVVPSAMVRLTVNMRFLRTAVSPYTLPSYCKSFDATLYSSGSLQSLDLFPLALATPERMNPLIAVRRSTSGNSTTSALAYDSLRVPSGKSGVTVRSLFSAGPYGDLFDIFAVSQSGLTLLTDTSTVLETMRSHVSPNVTYACVGDTLGASTVTCVLPVPIGANHINVQIMQSDFAVNVATITVKNAVQRAHDAMSKQCGRTYTFTGQTGLTGSCDVYHTCMNTIMNSRSAGVTATGNATYDFSTVEIAVPYDVQPNGCLFAFVAIVEFSQVTVPNTTRCDGFVCAADAQCISKEKLCDGASYDCSDLADETPCQYYKLAEVDVTISSEVDRVGPTINGTSTPQQCLQATMLVGGGGFLWRDDGGCEVFSTTALSAQFYPEPSSVIVNGTGSSSISTTQLFLSLPTIATYRRCSRYIHCNGFGELYNAGKLKDGDLCLCVCDARHTGSDCSLLRSMAVIAGLYAVIPTDPSLSVLVLQSALAAGNPFIVISVTPYVRFNGTHMAAPFSYASFDTTTLVTYGGAVFSTAFLTRVNSELSAGGYRTVSFIFSSDGVSTPSSYGKCAASGSQTFDCASLPTAVVDSVVLRSVGVKPPYTATLTLSSATATTSDRAFHGEASSGQTIQVTCDTSSSGVPTGRTTDVCMTMTCTIPVNTSSSVLTGLHIESPNSLAQLASDADPLTNCFSTYVELLAVTRQSFVAQSKLVQPEILHFTLQQFLIGGSVCFGIFGAFIVAGSSSGGAWTRALGRTMKARGVRLYYRSAGLAEWVRESFAYTLHTREHASLNLVTTTFVILFMLAVVIAGALVIIFQTSGSAAATFSLVARFYLAESCSGSYVVSLPYVVGTMAAEGICTNLALTGASITPIYMNAICQLQDNGKYVANVGLGLSATDCVAANLTVAPTQQCLVLTDYLPSASSSLTVTRVEFECLETDLLSQLVQQLTSLAPAIRANVDYPTTQPNPNNALNRQLTSYAEPASTSADVIETTSSTGTRLAGMTSSANFVGDFNPLRLVTQPYPVIFDGDASQLSNITTPVESVYRPYLATLSATQLKNMTLLIPHNGEYPLGFIVNNYKTTNSLSGTNAVQAIRYFGLAGSPFDVGTLYGPQSTDDLLGLTLSIWIRADRTTEGFAFAFADHFEDASSSTSPVLTKLMQIARDGLTSTKPWFAESFRVYSALYVSGSDLSLTYMFAEPGSLANNGSTADNATAISLSHVEMARFDLATINKTNVFNGGWHQLSLVLVNENQISSVRLYVDGVSSYGVGWRSCLTRRPPPVVTRNVSVVTEDVPYARVSSVDQGVVYVGYMNGGVANLQVDGVALPSDAIVRMGTKAIRINGAIRKVSMQVVGFGCAFCVLMSVIAVVKRFKRVKREKVKEREGEMASLTAEWVKVRTRIFGGGYNRPSLKQVVRWLDATPLVVLHVVEYCRDQTTELRADGESFAWTAVRILWLATRDAKTTEKLETADEIRTVYPSIGEWNQYVTSDLRDGEEDPEAGDVAVETAKTGAAAVKGGGGKSSSKAKKGGASGGGGAGSGIGTALQSTLFTFQAMAIYSSSWTMPTGYNSLFRPVLLVTSLDFVTLLQLPQTLRPLILFGAGGGCLLLLAFILLADQRKFYETAMRYVARRNTKRGLMSGPTEALKKMINVIDDDPRLERRVNCPYRRTVEVLPRNIRSRLFEFIGLTNKNDIQLNDMHGCAFRATHAKGQVVDPTTGDERDAEEEDINVTLEGGGSKPALLKAVQPRCLEHEEASLHLVTQTELMPDQHRYSCCAVVNGGRCGEKVGKMYVCLEEVHAEVEKDSDERGEYYTCNFALCAEHFSISAAGGVVLAIKAALRGFVKRGALWAIAQIIVNIMLALYTPVMQASFMIVSCHPFYACEFPYCWTQIKQDFAVVAYAAFVAIAVVGVGFPASLFLLLDKRRDALEDVFMDRRYKGRFMETDEQCYTAEDAIRVVEESKARSWVRAKLGAPEPFDTAPTTEPFETSASINVAEGTQGGKAAGKPRNRVERAREAERQKLIADVDQTYQRSKLVNSTFVPTSSLPYATLQQRQKELKTSASAWAEFLEADVSLLISLYAPLTQNAIAFAPISIVLKFVVVLPAVLLEPNSFVQLVAIMLGTAAYVTALELIDPFSGVWVAVVEHVGAWHQFAMVALQGYVGSDRNDNDVSDTMSTGMIGVTVAYALTVFIIVCVMILEPTARSVYDTVRLKLMYKRFAMTDFAEVPVYLRPLQSTAPTQTPSNLVDNDGTVEDSDDSTVVSDSDAAPTSEEDEPIIIDVEPLGDLSAPFGDEKPQSPRAARAAAAAADDVPFSAFAAPMSVVEERIARRQRRAQRERADIPADAREAEAHRFAMVRPSLFSAMLSHDQQIELSRDRRRRAAQAAAQRKRNKGGTAVAPRQ